MPILPKCFKTINPSIYSFWKVASAFCAADAGAASSLSSKKQEAPSVASAVQHQMLLTVEMLMSKP